MAKRKVKRNPWKKLYPKTPRKKRTKKIKPGPKPKPVDLESKIGPIDYLRSEVGLISHQLARLEVEHKRFYSTVKPGISPSKDAEEAKKYREIKKKIENYLDSEHLEACRITGVDPLSYALEWIDINAFRIFNHPRWVLLPNPETGKYDTTPGEHQHQRMGDFKS